MFASPIALTWSGKTTGQTAYQHKPRNMHVDDVRQRLEEALGHAEQPDIWKGAL